LQRVIQRRIVITAEKVSHCGPRKLNATSCLGKPSQMT
jgi:hypothetical protein